MPSRRLFRLAVASATVAAGLMVSTPACASITYDPEAKTGLVDKGDVRSAFGWTDVMLAARAPEVAFDQDFWTHDIYSVSCGGDTFSIEHNREYGKFELAAVLTHRRERGAAGYSGKLIGFRITGATAGISGTSVPPAIGQPCPRSQAPAATIDQAHLVSTTTGWALVARVGDIRHELLAQESPAPAAALHP